ncbi:MAG: hypothetical protein V3U28_00600 [Candidatus Acidoferrales bacterium]
MQPNLGSDGIWVSELNARARLERTAPVRFYDTTLRDGEQTVGVVLDPQQKLEIARKLDELGVSRIEAGFPRVSPDDAEAIRLILQAGLKAEVWGFARAVQADIEELVRLGVRACITETPTSEIKLRAYGFSRQQARERATKAVRYAKQHGLKVAFFAVDATRSELEFLKSVYQAVLEAEADEIVVVDTLGACSPEATEFLVGQVRDWIGPRVPLHFHGHNDFGLATASAIAAVRAGADWIHGTINGMGERAGNADIGEIALALRCLYGVPVALDLGKVREVSEFVQKKAGYRVDAWKPLVGENLFMRESGAVASQFHLPEAIEPFAAELVGARRGIVLGKKSGLDSIALKCKQLNVEVPEEQRQALLAAVKRKGIEKRGLLTDEEFLELVRQVRKR